MPDETATRPKISDLGEVIGTRELIKSIVQKLSSQLLLFSVAVIIFVLAAFLLLDGDALLVSLLILFVFLVGAAGYLFFEEKRNVQRRDPGTMNRLLGNQVANITKPASALEGFSVDLDAQRVNENSPGSRDISVVDTSEIFHIGDKINLRFRASRDCYLTLLNVGTSGKLTILFPNSIHPNNRVEGGVWHEIPGTSYGFEYELQGPPGTEKLKAIATLEPVQLLESNFTPDGSVFRQAESTAAARDIAIVQKKTASLPEKSWTEAYHEFKVVG